MEHSKNIDIFSMDTEVPSASWVIASELEEIEQFSDPAVRIEAGRTSLLGLIDTGEITYEQAREHGKAYFGVEIL